jgi:hypothetical protein
MRGGGGKMRNRMEKRKTGKRGKCKEKRRGGVEKKWIEDRKRMRKRIAQL